ncbi:hypothetical protein GCM10007855_36700 [Aliivibrio sifiae]|uniref:Antirestriction protein n=2 Tax=Aliivibrio sifiae TaxID=566293 RepID=A0ABQ6AKE7_9GAMM|nr:hypothetical protein GCM10007855_36700 [Aliivibrio sifiae]
MIDNSVYQSTNHKGDIMLTTSIVPVKERFAFLPSITKDFLSFEATLFSFAEMFSENYQGAYWQFISLSNGGKFLYPELEGSVRAINTYSHADVTFSSEAYGLCLTLMALSQRNAIAHRNGDEEENERLYTLYHQVRDYALEHKDAEFILTFID